MSDLESGEGSARRRPGTWGRASDNAHVYQSGADQYVTHIHIAAEARGQAADEARARADSVVQALTHAVGEWAARCQELEEQVRRAKSEGRAEAQAEFAKRLQDAELRVMQAQRVMREAEEERARAEAMLAQAQQELAQQRRAAERDREAVAPLRDPVGFERDRQDTEQFSDLMERAKAELGAVREELRQLGEEINEQDGGRDTARVVAGQWARQPGAAGQPASARSAASNGNGGVPARRAPAGTVRRTPAPGPSRRLQGGVALVLCMLPPWVPVVVITANRAVYASEATPLQRASFTTVSVLLGAGASWLALAIVVLAVASLVDDWISERQGWVAAVCVLAVAVCLFVAAFFTPLDWPGPAGEWGRELASLVGLG
ncbi:hypothetical protein AB0O86_11260 [Streptomyces hirsutus]|uniref:hypothetical protein n=1 Tax=Streptomyces hirsutus TaxID=35620 RepID=UPI003421A509